MYRMGTLWGCAGSSRGFIESGHLPVGYKGSVCEGSESGPFSPSSLIPCQKIHKSTESSVLCPRRSLSLLRSLCLGAPAVQQQLQVACFENQIISPQSRIITALWCVCVPKCLCDLQHITALLLREKTVFTSQIMGAKGQHGSSP